MTTQCVIYSLLAIVGAASSTSSSCRKGQDPASGVSCASAEQHLAMVQRLARLDVVATPNMEDHALLGAEAAIAKSPEMQIQNTSRSTPLQDVYLTQNSCLSGYTKAPAHDGLNGDLNQGAGGKDIFLCLQYGFYNPIGNLKLDTDRNCASGGSLAPRQSGMTGDLNQGAGGSYIYLCVERTGLQWITDVYLVPGGVCHGATGNLNQGAGGERIVLCMQKSAVPTPSPSQYPTQFPTQLPTQSPTQSPTHSPTRDPTQDPTKSPTHAVGCQSWCEPSSRAWATKCEFNACLACANCADHPGQLKPGGQFCEGWCKYSTRPWTTKCKFERACADCTGC